MTPRINNITKQPSHPAPGSPRPCFHMYFVPCPTRAKSDGTTARDDLVFHFLLGRGLMVSHISEQLRIGIPFELVSCFLGPVLVRFPAGNSTFKSGNLKGV